jgi:cold shock CspA family protein/ribosome-associated translation inhibitor RaiA
LSLTDFLYVKEIYALWHTSCRLYRRIVKQPGGIFRMKTPLQITFRNMPRSDAIEENVREKAAKLESLYDGITSCRVIVEAPHRHHYKGKAYVVRIDLVVPGDELVINRAPKRLDAAKANHPEELEKNLAESHEPSKHAAHEDAYVAIRDAFNAASRKLQDYARRRRGEKKIHQPAPVARIVKLFPTGNYGFIETPDGRELYFHKNSVLNQGFEQLQVGMEVSFAEELGEKGPQASTVRPVV